MSEPEPSPVASDLSPAPFLSVDDDVVEIKRELSELLYFSKKPDTCADAVKLLSNLEHALVLYFAKKLSDEESKLFLRAKFSRRCLW